MTDIEHAGLGAASLRSHPDIPIGHRQGEPCGYCDRSEHPMTQSDPTPPDDALLRLLAREAMSVGWYSEGFFRSLIDEDDDSLIEDADARFMAAVTPSVVLALLDLAALPTTPTPPHGICRHGWNGHDVPPDECRHAPCPCSRFGAPHDPK